MKKAVFFFLLAAFGFSAMASPVDVNQAMSVARNFVLQRVPNASNVTASVAYTHTMPQGGLPAMYAVNVTYGATQSGKAFVLVAADNVARPILGYSFARHWPAPSSKNGGEAAPLAAQITDFLDDLSLQIEAAATSQTMRERNSYADEWLQLTAATVAPLFANQPDSVGPLLVTLWDQSPYYNDSCPLDIDNPGSRAITGCVATGMAQIIRYWEYPLHGRGTHTYEDNSYGNFGPLTVNFENATYDYAHMPASLSASSTPAEVSAVAKLIYHCGVAADMMYGTGSSGSYDIVARAALINYFRYSPDISYVEKNSMGDERWDSILHAHLSANQPVLYSGHGGFGGHTFVCDGYKSDGYYHFNFGWSGSGNGWYQTSAVDPLYFDFTSNQSALVGIVPDNNGNVILANRLGSSKFTVGARPLEFYHTRGHDVYRARCYSNACSNTVLFTSADATKQIALDIDQTSSQQLTVYDGEGGGQLTSISGSTVNGPSQVISSANALYLVHSGNFYCDGYKVTIYQDGNSYVTVTALVNDAVMGTVTGGGNYREGVTVSLRATPNNGYSFVCWKNSAGEIVSNQAVYSFVVSGDVTFTAEFEPQIHTVTPVCSQGSSVRVVEGSLSVPHGGSVTLEVLTDNCHYFQRWDDGSSNPVRRIDNVVSDTTVVSYSLPYVYTVATNSTSGGSVSSNYASQVDCGVTVTLTATPIRGFVFSRWSDGNTSNPREVVVVSDTVLTAMFDYPGDSYEIRTCTGQTLLFSVNNTDHTAMVIGYVGQCIGSLTVPAWFSVDGVEYTVTAIGEHVFEGCTELVTVVLPASINTVGASAFKNCTSLITVDIK